MVQVAMTLRSHCFSPPIPEQGIVAPYTEIFLLDTLMIQDKTSLPRLALLTCICVLLQPVRVSWLSSCILTPGLSTITLSMHH